MAPPQSLGTPYIVGQTIEELRQSIQFWMLETFNHLDKLTGARGTPTLLGDMDINGKRLKSLGLPSDPLDVQRVDQCLALDALATSYDAKNRSIINIPTAVESSQAIPLSQLNDNIDESLLSTLDFVRRDGSIALTANWDAGSFEIRAQIFESDVATGTAPFVVASTTVVTNLNADRVDDTEAAAFALLAGRSGGQTLQGGTAASEDLTLESTSHATKGDILVPDGNGVVIGHTAQIDFGATPEFQVLGTATPDSSMGFARFEDNASGPDVRFLKSRGASIGSNIIVQDGDTIGRFRFQAADGNDFNTTAAEVSAQIDGTPGLNDMPGRLIFSVTADGASSVVERMRINATRVTMADDVLIARDVNAGLTASTTQTQGQGALTAEVNEVATCANVNDTVTLPSAFAGPKIVVINNGAQTLQIFPASGDDLGAGVNIATTLAAGSNVTFCAYDSTNFKVI